MCMQGDIIISKEKGISETEFKLYLKFPPPLNMNTLR